MDSGLEFDLAFTSMLQRAIRSLELMCQPLGGRLPCQRDWRLNACHYGALQGVRRSGQWGKVFDLRPPPSTPEAFAALRADPLYSHVEDLPRGESVADLAGRVRPLWAEVIAPALLAGRRALIVGHGNCMRAFLSCVEPTLGSGVMAVRVPTGNPLVCHLDDGLRLREITYLDD